MAKQCYAPVFQGNNGLVCLFEGCRCTIKQIRFRIANCVKGNSNPELPI